MNFNQNLFQQAAAAAAASRHGGNKPLLEFKAGKMNKEGNLVKPDTRKGLIQITVEENILHFKWKERTANRAEDDLLLFPGDATFKKVEKVKDGRVYMLEFTNGDRQMFFWMQEPKIDKDEEYCTKINEYLRNPPQSNQYVRQQQNFMNLFGNQERSSSGSIPSIEFDQLQRILQGLGPSSQPQQQQQQRQQQQSTTQQQQSTTQQQQQQSESQQNQVPMQLTHGPTGPSLSAILNSDALCQAIMKHPEVVKQLAGYLPEKDQNADMETIIQHIRSPQFRQAIDVFNRALYQSPDIVCYSIGIRPTNELLSSLYSGGSGAESFLNAVNNQERKDNDKKDDKMETDE
jgi:hypothetical protein